MLWEYIKAILYGVIEGITEWLPISSTGHLILLGEALKINIDGSAELNTQFAATLDVVVQLGAIIAVPCIYPHELLPTRKKRGAVLSLWTKLAIATIPAALIGLCADALCQRYLGRSLDSLIFNPQVVACALIVYGILFILVEKLARNDGRLSEITPRRAFAIGLFQSLAIIPGTSRSGATILGARILGIPRKSAAAFSFLAALPVIAAASLLKIYDLAKYLSVSGESLSLSALLILFTAALSAFILSLFIIRFMTDFIKRHTFIPFGVYRILLGICVLIFIK